MITLASVEEVTFWLFVASLLPEVISYFWFIDNGLPPISVPPFKLELLPAQLLELGSDT